MKTFTLLGLHSISYVFSPQFAKEWETCHTLILPFNFFVWLFSLISWYLFYFQIRKTIIYIQSLSLTRMLVITVFGSCLSPVMGHFRVFFNEYLNSFHSHVGCPRSGLRSCTIRDYGEHKSTDFSGFQIIQT